MNVQVGVLGSAGCSMAAGRVAYCPATDSDRGREQLGGQRVGEVVRNIGPCRVLPLQQPDSLFAGLDGEVAEEDVAVDEEDPARCSRFRVADAGQNRRLLR